MSSITPIQNQQINPLANQVNKKIPTGSGDKTETAHNNISDPVLNKMSQQLNESAKHESIEISQQQTQNLIPDTGSGMMGAQTGNITAEFVANLLNKSPYDN